MTRKEHDWSDRTNVIEKMFDTMFKAGVATHICDAYRYGELNRIENEKLEVNKQRSQQYKGDLI